MAAGSPIPILERGEKVQLPPAVWFQVRGDAMHGHKGLASDPGNEPQRFVAAYRKGGRVNRARIRRGRSHPDASS